MCLRSVFCTDSSTTSPQTSNARSFGRVSVRHSMALSLALLLSVSEPHALTSDHVTVSNSAPAASQIAPPLKAGMAQPTGTEQIGRKVYGITEYRLANGLTVLIRPDDTKPTMTINLVYKVGSRHEGPGEAGMAHLLEHMLFKGTTVFPTPDEEMRRRGIDSNGTTSLDRTNYYGTFNASDETRDWMLGWLADAMQNVRISEEKLKSERSVVLNEMDADDDSRSGSLSKLLRATAYQFHPYGRPVIGTRSDVEAMSAASLQRFYQTWYRPDNAVLIITGKFESGSTLAKVQQLFGSIPRPSALISQPHTLEPVQQGEREAVLRREGGNPMLRLAYHIPDVASRDSVALKILGLMLTIEPEGELYIELVKPGHATGISASTTEDADPGLLVFYVSFTDEKQRDLIRNTLVRHIEQNPKLHQSLLDLLKQAIRHARERIGEDAESMALSLGKFAALGDWRLGFARGDWAEQMSLDEIRAAAKRWLVRDNRTLAWYMPTENLARAPQHARTDVAAALQNHQWPEGNDFVPDVPITPEYITSHAQKGQLPNGLRYALLPRKIKGDRVKLNLDLRWGSLESLSGRWRDVDFLDGLLKQETRSMSQTQLRDRLIELDADMSVSGGSGGAKLWLDVPRRNLEAAMTLAASMMREPVFRDDLFQENRRAAFAGIKASQGKPQRLIAEEFSRRGRQYPLDDPRHDRTEDALRADYEAQTTDRMARFWKDFAGASEGELSAMGNFDPDELKALVQQLFGDWKTPHPYQRFPDSYHHYGTGRVILTTPDHANAEFTQTRQFRMSQQHADYPALALAVRILGSGPESRLWKRVREQEGLSYSVSASLDASYDRDDANIDIDASFAPKNLHRLEAAIDEEIRRALEHGFTQQELDDARRRRQEGRRAYLADEDNLVSMMSSQLYWGTSMKEWLENDTKLASLTLDEVNAAFRKWFSPDQSLTVAAGSFEKSQITALKQ